jgi:dihydrofolate reductase
VYGGAGFVSSLIKEGLIDEYHLFLNPAAIGKGMSIFAALNEPRKFALKKVTPFECGIVVLHYEPAKG